MHVAFISQNGTGGIACRPSRRFWVGVDPRRSHRGLYLNTACHPQLQQVQKRKISCQLIFRHQQSNNNICSKAVIGSIFSNHLNYVPILIPLILNSPFLLRNQYKIISIESTGFISVELGKQFADFDNASLVCFSHCK